MSLKVNELLDGIKGENIKIVAGHKGLQNMVRWVHMVESVEISRDLDGNEIIFTTGIGLKDESELIDLVKSNYENGASGMVINIGPFISEITEEIIEFGNIHAFPIFEVPWEVRMARITQKFSRMITEHDISNTKLSSALKDAIYFPENENLYVRQFLTNGFAKVGKYQVVLLENTNFRVRLSLDELQVIEIKNKERVLVTEVDNIMMLVFYNCTPEQLNSGIQQIKNYLMRMNSYYDLYFAIGTKVKEIRFLVKSFQSAEKVLRLKAFLANESQIIYFDEIGIYELFLMIEDDSMLKAFSDKILKPIRDFDSVNSTNLLEVLEMYLECNGSVAAVSERLFIHKNTVNYKISKISALMNANLSDFEIRTKFEIAFKIRNIIKD